VKGGEAISLHEARSARFDALINATPVGMTPNVDASIFEESVPADVVMDMVYNPHETKLLKLARKQGATTIHGIEMLLEQAAHQFEIWTGESAPRSMMKRAIEDH
jgi:3-dehydroquinate dehydratase/shikimate dehydrogenase